ncbi:hypothetical protein [Acinetobacter sp. CFCC 10889]|uniref:hypothetical protein n=1 Tax=Acinetobacter sp. CFCC 10889 TaxID=1775557 RepID=UPI0013A68B1A|nr:hypothetical protein [Acinetobacter sp. CFCC 10889]
MKRLALMSMISWIYILLLPFAHADNRFVGLWQEITFYDDSGLIEDSDNGISVDDSEYYFISNDQNQYSIKNIDAQSIFTVEQVKHKGSTLKFVMINHLEPDDLYILNYECHEKIKHIELKCKFTNQKGELEENIIWKKRTQKMTSTK